MILDREQVKKYLPHREPFLFVDSVQNFEKSKSIEALLYLDPCLAFFKGHFPQNPIMPGVLITESLAQTCGLIIALSAEKCEAKVFYLASNNMKFKAVAHAGDTLTLSGTLLKQFGTLFQFSATAKTKRDIIATGTIVLASANGK